MTISVDDPRWDTRLMKPHRLELIASGITPDTAHAAGLYSESDPARIAQLLHWSTPAMGLGACLVYPFLDRLGQPTGYHRLKPSKPRIAKSDGKDAKAIKYEGPKGQSNRLYIPPGTRAALADPSQTLFITEGEKKSLAADGAGFACVSVPGVWAWQKKRDHAADGAARGPRELIDDLAAIAWVGRVVFVIFDSDAVKNGKVLAAERALVKALESRGARVRAIRLLAAANGAKRGLDDFLVSAGADALQALLAPGEVEPHTKEESDKNDKKPTTAEALVRLAIEQTELWHDPEGEAFVSIARRAMAVRSKPFRQWLVQGYFQSTGGRVPNAEAMTSACAAIEASANYHGLEFPVHVRIAGHAEKVFLHLGDPEDTVVAIDAEGWRVCDRPPIRFRRSLGMRALPKPVRGGSLEELRQVLVLQDEDTFTLILAFLMGLFLPEGPYPTLVLSGEQGSGKSTLSRAIKALIDPSAAPVRCEPKEPRDLTRIIHNS